MIGAENDLPKIAGGSGDEPVLARPTTRRQMMRHNVLHETIQTIRGADGLVRLSLGEGRAFRKSNIIRRG